MYPRTPSFQQKKSKKTTNIQPKPQKRIDILQETPQKVVNIPEKASNPKYSIILLIIIWNLI